MSRLNFQVFKESIELLFINLKVTFRNLIEFIKVVFKYYSTLSFLKIDSTLLLSYLFHNPFRISKKFLQQKGDENLYTYGETPLTTLDQIAHTCQITSDDTVFELGCGRGRNCFWLNQFIGCEVVGVEYIPEFVQRANRIQEHYHVEKVHFRLEDLATTDLTSATIIYLYGTCFDSEFIEMLAKRFSLLPKGTKVITVSYALEEFDPSAAFKIEKCFPAQFTWGVTDVYLQIRN